MVPVPAPQAGSGDLISIEVDLGTPQFEDVKALGRAQAALLGFFPDGAFEDAARRKQILACSVAGQIVGYLLYRNSRGNSLAIVHLCVSPAFRGRGVAKFLVAGLRGIAKPYRGIGLACRRDYEANRIWPRLGFLAAGERPGRSADGSVLTIWWLGSGNRDLFSDESAKLSGKLVAVIDANVFLDLHNHQNDESQGLLADWLSEDVSIATAPEILNEIERNDNHAERESLRRFRARFDEVSAGRDTYSGVEKSLKKFLPPSPRESDYSDVRQLAWTIASQSDVFVTRDGGLLGHSEAIFAEFGVTVARPSELISQLDATHREREYQRSRLAGTLLRFGQEVELSEEEIATRFVSHSTGEKKS